MRYLTARKRAIGKGSAHTGTAHHWSMTMSAVALAFMVPTWVYIFGHALGQDYEVVRATFAHPFPAILTALILVIGMRHFAMGATMMIEDYTHGTMRKALIIFVISLTTVIAATGLYALIRIAL
ncbi:succinate dehydrogenase [Cypionkella aquatica]|uniref:Succinate dehydrogenase hydrophobic membrane anchor subunit n=1 Tax=Cypionkella aquatica TaxID=1756042 RepID=A0AA37TVJ8_9RHOB|nr:succinate dehydrogenase, hydrophobic membrane anchor protein [Cypionkella aquatica]GLS88124.1 succinate dehydrogenase [Cypionkella aquatica]